MTTFINDLLDPDFPFLRNGLLLGLLVSVPVGVVGAMVIARRISYLAAAIAHTSLAGVGAALYVGALFGLSWLTPRMGAVVAAVTAAWLLGLLSLRGREREDAAIGIVWTVGMALGLLLINATPGYLDPMSYLFGDIGLAGSSDLLWTLVLGAVVAATGTRLYRDLNATCFDAEYARLRRVKVERVYLILLTMTALTVVLLITVVGIVLSIALLTIPAAIASRFARTLWQMMLGTGLTTALLTTFGIAAAYELDMPAGPVIILLGGAVYGLVAMARR